ncbi:Uridine kinase [Oceanobacillus limi]|uniref:Uridine kinase n=1 Tax=Oceanobacillus limi TaxID=930131 RepID=A0A1H9Y0J4_9BACI|nr:AAA family ATPase [Oceanobacillus limi]SES61714.1 Uridine kinase [Oceanobacillus limi]
MQTATPPLVVTIAAISGGGKTTITKYLKERLQNSKALYFDDYDFDGPLNIIDWVDRGADYDEWNLSPLLNDVELLLKKPLEYILIDYPFAYKHTKAIHYINLAVYIDTPLDIAMARRITRDYKNSSKEKIFTNIQNYVSFGRRGYLEMINTIKPNSDIIVDGTLPIPEIAELIYEKIQTWKCSNL